MKQVCFLCITDSYLERCLPDFDGACSYCDRSGRVAEIAALALECDRVIDTHFEITHRSDAVRIFEQQPDGLDLRGTLDLMNFISRVSETPGLFDGGIAKHAQILEDIALCLESHWGGIGSDKSKHSCCDDTEAPHFRFRSDMGYPLGEDWRKMHDSLQYHARFLNPEAHSVLRRIFGNIASDWTGDGQPVVADGGPKTALNRLFRARVFQSEKPLIEAIENPARLLGTPENGIGPPGRMNARGQPAFYGATTEEVAIAEVRPPVGAWVVTAAFDIVRPVKLLDFRALSRVQLQNTRSLFDLNSILSAQRRDFLSTLVKQLTLPVMPESQERDYLVTQVIADFLSTNSECPLDGIIYPSVQKTLGSTDDAYNVVLFSRSSQVFGSGGLPIGSLHLYEDIEDGPGKFLSPELYPKDPTPQERESFMLDDSDDLYSTLRISLESIRVAKAIGISINTTGGEFVRVGKLKPSAP